MAEEKKDSKSKVIIILVIVIVLLLIAVAVGITYFVMSRDKTNQLNIDESLSDVHNYSSTINSNSGNIPKLDYDNGAVILDQNTLQKAYDEMVEKTKDGQMTLSFKNEAVSTDGVNFTCHIENAPENKPDMYITIYKDNTLSEMLYLSGLIKPGTGIDHFTSEIKLDPGNYTSVLILTQVDDDHQTMKGSLSVTLELKVD